jgi:hypothetical protein
VGPLEQHPGFRRRQAERLEPFAGPQISGSHGYCA